MVLTVVLGLVLYVFYEHTRPGLAVRAVAEDPEVAMLMGISRHRVVTASWAAGVGVTGVAATLAAPAVGLTPTFMESIAVFAFASAVLGGFGSLMRRGGGRLPDRDHVEPGGRLLVKQPAADPGVRPDRGGPLHPARGAFRPGGPGAGVKAGPGTRAVDRLSKGMLRRAAGRTVRPAGQGAPAAWARITRLGVAAVVVVAAVLFPLFEGGNITVMGLATEALTYGLVAVALNLLMGYGGQISIGHAGFLAIGAYTTAIVARHYTVPFILVLLSAGLVSAVVGFLLGLPAGRLRSHYLAVATLGFGLAVPQVALNMSLTGGFTGLIVPTQQLGSIQLSSPVPLYYLALILVALAMTAVISLLASPSGRRFMAIRDREEVAPAMGINVPLVKLTLFSLSAFFTGLAGYVFALNNSIVEPGFVHLLTVAVLLRRGDRRGPGLTLGAAGRRCGPGGGAAGDDLAGRPLGGHPGWCRGPGPPHRAGRACSPPGVCLAAGQMG